MSLLLPIVPSTVSPFYTIKCVSFIQLNVPLHFGYMNCNFIFFIIGSLPLTSTLLNYLSDQNRLSIPSIFYFISLK